MSHVRMIIRTVDGQEHVISGTEEEMRRNFNSILQDLTRPQWLLAHNRCIKTDHIVSILLEE